MKPRIALLAGDPGGIGPELTAKLLASPELPDSEILLVGDPRVFATGGRIAGKPVERPVAAEILAHDPAPPATALRESGEFSLRCLEAALQLIQARRADALVFAPLNKQAMKLAGLRGEDEMRHIAAVLGHSGPLSEINICGALATSRVTSHIPLVDVASSLSEARVHEAIVLLDATLRRSGRTPRLGVAGLNPHAGEGGTMGREEIDVIAPAVARARESGILATGPWPADTIFVRALHGEFDGIVTMYHDQGQIAMKLMGFDRGVTVHAGFPYPIATPAHGTAFDIAGKGVAAVSAMREAFLLACRMAAAEGEAEGQ